MKNLISFFEIPTLDIDKAVKFYNDLFENKIEVVDCGEEKMAFFPGEENNVNGAISQAENFRPSDQGVLIHFDVTGKLDYILEKVTVLGGKIIKSKTIIIPDEHGYFAIILDFDGNRIGLHSAGN